MGVFEMLFSVSDIYFVFEDWFKERGVFREFLVGEGKLLDKDKIEVKSS